ncbi:unnamed protein product, partial [Didymodactylos carnosus]
MDRYALCSPQAKLRQLITCSHIQHHSTTTVRNAWSLCLLTFQNLMRIRRRIQPVTDGGERNASQIKVKQRDRQLISMLLAEV